MNTKIRNSLLGTFVVAIFGLILYVVFGPPGSRVFFVEGFFHILTGWDHILFIIAIHLLVIKPIHILEIVTAFTLAHSLTLILTALGFISLPSKLVESVIALSIVVMALENIYAKYKKGEFKNEFYYRWGLTSFFGLIHGMGFAGFLKELFISQKSLIPGILGFNLGVELGQLVVVSVVVPTMLICKKLKWDRVVTFVISTAIALIAGSWTFGRLFYGP